MQFPELRKYHLEYPSLSETLGQVEIYLGDLLAKIQAGKCKKDIPINPSFIAHTRKLSKAEVLLCLQLFYDEGLVRPTFQVWCRHEDMFIEEFSSYESIPEEIECPHDGEFHSKSEEGQDIDIKFRFYFTEKTLKNLTSKSNNKLNFPELRRAI